MPNQANDLPIITKRIAGYIAKHPGKGGTKGQLEITARSLCKKLGDDRRVDEINAGDAEDFRKWLQTKHR